MYYLVKAAERQAGLGSPRDAAQKYTEAIDSLRALDPTPERQVLMARTLIRCGRLLRALGERADADEMLAGALESAQGAENERLALEARIEQAISDLWAGRADKAVESLRELEGEANRLGSDVNRALALNSLAVANWQGGNLEEALKGFQSLARLAERLAAPQIEADAFNNAGLIYWKWNQYAQALKAFRRALPLRRKAGDPFGLCATLMNVGIMQEQMGEAGAARRSYRNALRLAQRTGYAQGLAALESNLSNVERRAGTGAAALEHAMKAVEYSREAEDPYLESIAEENAGLALALAGRTDEARERLERARTVAHDHKHTECEASARLSILEIGVQASGLPESGTGKSGTGVRPVGSGAGTPPVQSRTGVPPVSDDSSAGFQPALHGQPAPAGRNAHATQLDEINAVLRLIDDGKFATLKPRACRIKARILDALGESNALTAREYLDLARDLARDAGDFFEELDSWRALRDFAQRRNDAALLAESAPNIERMEKMIALSGGSDR